MPQAAKEDRRETLLVFEKNIVFATAGVLCAAGQARPNPPTSNYDYGVTRSTNPLSLKLQRDEKAFAEAQSH